MSGRLFSLRWRFSERVLGVGNQTQNERQSGSVWREKKGATVRSVLE